MNKTVKQILAKNGAELAASQKRMQDIFEIMFSCGDRVLCEGNDGFRTYKYTFGEIKAQIDIAAAALYQKIGATHSFVALEIENSTEWIIAFWAILKSGNKPYLVNMRYPAALTEQIFKTLKIEHIVCCKSSDLDGNVIDVADLKESTADLPDDIFEDEIAFSSSATSMNEVICFYSGVQIAEQILNFKSIVKENPRIAKFYKGGLKQLAFLPFYHVFGLFAVYFWFTFFGCSLVFLRNYSADTILKTCRKHEVTHIFAVPMLWHTIEKQITATVADGGEKLQKKLARGLKAMTALQNICPTIGANIAKKSMSQITEKLFGKSVIFCISGGSYLRDSALKLINGIGYSLHNGYGMSEVGITSVELRKRPKHLNQNSIGRPFDAVQYRIDQNGQLLIKGSTLCTKKLINGQPLIMDDSWFETGDIVEQKGEYYHILGRMGDVVIGENGENINPDSVEKLFCAKSAKQFSVLGLKAEDGEELSMVVQISPYATPAVIEGIKNEIYGINNTLPTASAVKSFYFTFEDLAPPTAVKISRTQLVKKIKEGEIKLIPFSALNQSLNVDFEETPIAKAIKEIIAKELAMSPLDITPASHIFYDLGATSIQYFSILSALSEHFEISNYSKTDKYCYTLKEMSEYIERHL